MRLIENSPERLVYGHDRYRHRTLRTVPFHLLGSRGLLLAILGLLILIAGQLLVTALFVRLLVLLIVLLLWSPLLYVLWMVWQANRRVFVDYRLTIDRVERVITASWRDGELFRIPFDSIRWESSAVSFTKPVWNISLSYMKASNYYTSAQIQVADEAEGQAILAHIADAVGHDTPIA